MMAFHRYIMRFLLYYLIKILIISCISTTCENTVLDKILSPDNTIREFSSERFKCRNITHNSNTTSKQTPEYSICCVIINKNYKLDLDHVQLQDLPNDAYTTKCIPSFIIAGTQKSGTTALSAYLTTHPSIKFSSKKEVHFFDKKATSTLGVEAYLSYFPTMSQADLAKPYPPLYAESTPFYIASRYACMKIADMIPNAKIIILLREPSSRAYSEYQMKKRRVGTQNDFISIIHRHADVIFNCLMHLVYDTWHDMETRCFPPNITSHQHYDKFYSSFPSNNALLSKAKSMPTNNAPIVKLENLPVYNDPNIIIKSHRLWQATVTRCFATSPEPASSSSSGGSQRHRAVRERERELVMKADTYGRMMSRKAGRGLIDANLTHHHDDQDHSYVYDGQDDHQYGYHQHQLTIKHDNHHDHDVAWQNHAFTVDSKYEPLSSSSTHGDDHRMLVDIPPLKVIDYTSNLKRYFQPKACMGKAASEALKPMNDAFQNEIHDFSSCSYSNSTESVEQLDQDIDRCLKVIRTGIAHQYFYRSLYAVQLHNCFKYIPREQFFIVSMEELEANPSAVIARVLQFLSIDDVTLQDDASMSKEFIKAAVDKYFPHFEEQSGWRLQGNYDPIPHELDRYLKQFFQPYNLMLDNLLNAQFSSIWNKPTS